MPDAEDTVRADAPDEVGSDQAADTSGETDAEQATSCLAMLEAERLKSQEYEAKYKRALADYLNLERRTAADVQAGINQAVDGMMRDFLNIYDDFVRARDAYRVDGSETPGLDSVLKNTDAMIRKHGITPIESLGQMFDPQLHEAMATKSDPDLEDQTITQELRKGYIAHDKRVIRTALVEISTKSEMS